MAARSLGAAADPDSGRLALLLPRAIRFYLDEGEEEPGWPYPSFLDGPDGVGGGREVGLDEGIWQQLRGEARRQEVAVEDLLQHATFYYAAARDEGRLTRRIAEELRHEEKAKTA